MNSEQAAAEFWRLLAFFAILAKQAAGESLSHAEKRLIAKSRYGQRVANEMDPANIRAGNTASAWAQNIGTERINAAEYNSAPVNAVANQGSQSEQQRLLRREELSQNLQTLKKQLKEQEDKLAKKQAREVSAGWLRDDTKQVAVLKNLIDITDNELKRIENTKASQSSAESLLSESGESVENSRENALDFSRTYDRISGENVVADQLQSAEENDPSETKRERLVRTLEKNKRAGKRAEIYLFSVFDKMMEELVGQVTIKVNETNIKVRVDAIGFEVDEHGVRQLKLLEFKASKTARLTKNQTEGYPVLAEHGGTVAGRKKRGLPYGFNYVIPPGTPIDVIRIDEGGSWRVSERFRQSGHDGQD